MVIGGEYRLELAGGPALGKLVAVKLVRPMFGSIGCNPNRSEPSVDVFVVEFDGVVYLVRDGQEPSPETTPDQAFEYLRGLDVEIPWCDPGFPNAVWWESFHLFANRTIKSEPYQLGQVLCEGGRVDIC